MSAVAKFAPAQFAPAKFAPARVSSLPVRVASHLNAVPVLPALPAGKTRLRITRRGRAVLMTLVAVPVVVAAMMFALNGGGAIAGDDPNVPLEHVTIAPGQTLWGLAEEYAPHSDPRDFVADVVSLNSIQNVLEAGQVIDIPSKYSN